MKTWKETILHIEDIHRFPRTYEELKELLLKQAEPSYKQGYDDGYGDCLIEEAYTRQLEQESKEGQMGWQETVQRGLVGEYQSIARVQAEATWRVAFKAGYAQGSLRHLGSLTQQVHEEGRKEGMGEVARWLEENNIFDECTQEIGVWWQSWQAFLKEKDIGDSNGK